MQNWQKSKLIELLKSLDKKEFKQFEEYVLSPFFNKNKKVVGLLSFLKKFHPTYEHKQLNKQKAFIAIFGKTTYYDQKLRNLMTDLAKLLEGFLVHQEIQSQTNLLDYHLLSAYNKKNLDKYFLKKYNQIQNDASLDTSKDVTYYKDAYQLEEIAYAFSIMKGNRPLNTNLQQVVNSFDQYYLLNKLRYSCAILNRQSVLAVKYEMPLLQEIISYLDKHPLEQEPIIILYYQLFLTLKNEAVEDYQTLKNSLQKYRHLLGKHELRQIYTATFNYCNKQLKSGQQHYLREIFELYQWMLEKDLLLVEGVMRFHHFRNITMAALRLGEIDWAKQFLRDYAVYLLPEYRVNMLAYCTAALHFYQKNFEQTLQHLLGFEFQDTYHYMEHKILLLQTYYELRADEALFALAHAVQNYLRRNTTIAAHFQQTYQNFVRLTVKLCKLDNNPNKQKQELWAKLKMEIQETEPLTEVEWLVEKCKM